MCASQEMRSSPHWRMGPAAVPARRQPDAGPPRWPAEYLWSRGAAPAQSNYQVDAGCVAKLTSFLCQQTWRRSMTSLTEGHHARIGRRAASTADELITGHVYLCCQTGGASHIRNLCIRHAACPTGSAGSTCLTAAATAGQLLSSPVTDTAARAAELPCSSAASAEHVCSMGAAAPAASGRRCCCWLLWAAGGGASAVVRATHTQIGF